VRSAVLGTANRAPTTEELDAMRALVRRAMEAGAVGMSTGLIYVPGTYAKTDELVALCEVVAEFGGVYASHMRNEAGQVLTAIDEALEIGRRAGVHVQLSHLKASGKPHWGRSAEIVEKLRAARAAGQRVTGDQYAYTASSTGLEVLFPSEALSVGRKEFARLLAEDATLRAEMDRALRRHAEESGFGDFAYAQIANAPEHEELSGARIDAAAEQVLGRRDLDAQIELIARLMIDAGGSRVQMVYHKMCEDDVERIMREPWVAVASDSGIRMHETASKPHPRGAGNNPRVLGHYVRERGVVPLALAIHKMTALPAGVFGLEDRGAIRTGAFADLVLFDPERVIDGATYEDPLAPPRGIACVIVNGEVVAQDGEHTGARPGMVLRHVPR
jgi:N-acyl-D-amino-acid deacylase